MQLTNYSVNYSNIRKQTSEGTYVTVTKGNAVFTFTDIETETKHKLNLTNANYSAITLDELNKLIDYYLDGDHKNDATVTVAQYTSTDNDYRYTVTISGGSGDAVTTIAIPTYSYEFYEMS